MTLQFEELWKIREQHKIKYNTMREEILAKKMKLYEKEPDLTKWGIIDHIFIEKYKSKLKSDFAFA